MVFSEDFFFQYFSNLHSITGIAKTSYLLPLYTSFLFNIVKPVTSLSYPNLILTQFYTSSILPLSLYHVNLSSSSTTFPSPAQFFISIILVFPFFIISRSHKHQLLFLTSLVICTASTFRVHHFLSVPLKILSTS